MRDADVVVDVLDGVEVADLESVGDLVKDVQSFDQVVLGVVVLLAVKVVDAQLVLDEAERHFHQLSLSLSVQVL